MKALWGAYAALLTAVFLVSVAAGWTTLGLQFDNDVYDFLFRASNPPAGAPSSVLLGIDEETLRQTRGGVTAIRGILAKGAGRLAEAKPAAVVVDIILADKHDDEADAALAAALAKLPNLVLSTDITRQGWEDPIPVLRATAAAIGHVHPIPDPYDNVVRKISLERIAGGQRRFALALEAYRLASGGAITESPSTLEVGPVSIHAPRETWRPLWIRYRPPDSPVPHVGFAELARDPAAAAKLAGKVVFIGVTAQSATQDRHMTPYSFGQTMAGVEINANAYETLAGGRFIQPVRPSVELASCFVLAAAAGAIFALTSGWAAWLLAGLVLIFVHAAPAIAWSQGWILPYAPLLSAAWLSIVAAASFQHFVVRRNLVRSEAEKDRYQRAIHFVAHEMKTPLTAIQGSSELMGRYKLTEEKRAEMARMINSESKRLGSLIRTFLDVERLSEGQIEMKREPFEAREVVETSMARAAPLAERKGIELRAAGIEPALLRGDRELLEYAVYNLVNNAIKYSPSDTAVTVSAAPEAGRYRISVADQGIGMDEKELKNIFRKFYRTKRAEATGEAGTGIGLSIVDQIVMLHGGRMDVASEPGKGSRFTIALPLSEK